MNSPDAASDECTDDSVRGNADPIAPADQEDLTIRDGLPGFPIDGYPEWRAGAFGSGGGLLGMHPVDGNAGDDAGSASSADARLVPAAYFGKGPNVLPDYQTKSWRWNDPEAIAYDADRKRGQIGQVRGMTNAIEGLGILNVLPPWPARGVGIAGALLGHGEAVHLQDQLNALEARQKQLRGQGAI